MYTVNAFFCFYSGWIQHNSLPYNWKLIYYHTYTHKSMPTLPAYGCTEESSQTLTPKWDTCIRRKPIANQVWNHFFLAWPFLSACAFQKSKTKRAIQDQAGIKKHAWLHVCRELSTGYWFMPFCEVLWTLHRNSGPQIRVGQGLQKTMGVGSGEYSREIFNQVQFFLNFSHSDRKMYTNKHLLGIYLKFRLE